MEFQPQFSITNKIAYHLAKIERARGFFEAIHLSEKWLSTMQNKALLLEAHHTTHIEGTELTLDQSEKILAGRNLDTVNIDDALELKNYVRAFELVSEYLHNKNPITELLIREMHKRLVLNVRGNEANPGEYRKIQNYIVNSKTQKVIYTPPTAYQVDIMMHHLLEWINNQSEINPILVSGIAQFQLVHIHPFLDGNGRTARLLSTLCLYKQGYDFKRLFTLSEYYDRDRNKYYNALQAVRNNNMEMTSWLEYFVEGLSTQINELESKSAQIVKYDLLAKNGKISARQYLAIEYILEYGAMTIKNYELLCPDVNKRTLQRELRGLIDSGTIIIKGTTNDRIYKLKLETDDKLMT